MKKEELVLTGNEPDVATSASGHLLSDLWQDLRYGTRMLRKSPGYSAIMALTLALGIGANTTVFSVVDAVLFRPLPYKEAEQLVDVLSSKIGAERDSKLFDSYSDFLAWKNHSTSFDELAACTWARPARNLTWQGKTQRVLGIPASAGFFSLLGVRAAEGRTFEPQDAGNGDMAVLSHHFWQSRLGGAPNIVGASVTLDGRTCIVAGIMPEDFNFYPKQADLWVMITPDSAFARDPLNSIVVVYGRLRQGVSREAARAELAVLHRQVVDSSPPDSWVSQVEPTVSYLQEEFTWLAGRNLRTSLLVLLAVVVCVLFIACMNVANLLLGRGVVRQKELAIRTAMGSSRARLVRQLLSESLLLSVLGTIPGILLAFVAVRLFRASSPIELPPGNTLNVNLRILAFAAFLSVLTAFVFGLVPALKASRVDLNEVLKSTGRNMIRGVLSHRAGKLLVISQLAVSFVLVTAAILFIESLVGLHNSPLGFRAENLLTARVDLPASTYPHNAERVRFYDELTSRLSALPGVEGAALTSSLPLSGAGNSALVIEGKQEAIPNGGVGDVGMDTVSSNYFRVSGIPLRAGREFDSLDREDSQPVALVNDALVERYFPNEDPVGKHIKFGKPDDRAPWLTVIGVVGNDKRTIVYKEMDYIVGPFIFRPATQAAGVSTAIVIRLNSSGLALAPALESEVSGVDSNATLYDVRTMEDRISEFLIPARSRAVASGVFASLALALAAIGIYGVLSQSTLQRRQEIGIRMALGAQPRDILRLVIGQGVSLALIGVGTGLCATLALTRFIASLLYGVKPTDPATLLIGVTLLIGIAIVACYLPARRATKVDPMVALRSE